MQVVILSGGSGSRISEENFLKPKPMIEIGNRPVLWHIMKYFSAFGHNDFVICLGYKQYLVKSYFADYFLHNHDVEINVENNSIKVLDESVDKWNVKLIDTGIDTKTAGRIKRVEKYLEDNFFLVYGDAVSDIDINALMKSHIDNKKILTLTTVKLANQKGVIEIDDNNAIISFREKSSQDSVWVNSGYMVCSKRIIDYIDGDLAALDDNIFPKLLKENQINSYKHSGQWQMIEKEKDVKDLNKLWTNNEAYWLKN